MKYINKITYIVWFLLFLIGIDRLTSYLVINDAGTPGRYILHGFYNREENIDTLFLGSSHTMYGIDPEVYESITGNKAYSCGTNFQYMDGSFALLKEADQRYHLKHVYIDVFFSVCRTSNRKERSSADLIYSYYISDYMKPSWNKYSYIFSASSPEHYIEALFPQRRYIKNLTDFSYIKNNLDKKRAKNYQNYTFQKEYEAIIENGQTVCKSSLENKGFFYEGINDPIQSPSNNWEEWKELLVQMINYCEEHHISITFMTLPMSDFYIMQGGAEDYDGFANEVREVLEISGSKIDYIDFNLMKTEYLNLQERDFRDISHLNSEGAEKVSVLLADLESEENKDQFFYSSYQEKITTKENVYGISIVTDKEHRTLELIPVTNVDEDRITYRITNSGKKVKVSYSEHASFSYEAGETYVIQAYIDEKLCNTIWYTGN